jgi:hypothetical protein
MRMVVDHRPQLNCDRIGNVAAKGRNLSIVCEGDHKVRCPSTITPSIFGETAPGVLDPQRFDLDLQQLRVSKHAGSYPWHDSRHRNRIAWPLCGT